MDLLRDSSLGQLIRFFAGNQCLLHPEEQAGFTYPCNEEILSSEVTSPRLKRQDPALASSTSTVNNRPPQSSPTSADCDSKTLKEPSHTTPPSIDPEASTLESGAASQVLNLEADEGNEKACSLGVHKDFILVDWYDGIDTQNPQNWSQGKKAVVTSVLWLYTFTVYCASSIYTPSVEGVMKEYHVDQTLSSLGLSLYVLGYGIGPLVFSPISEIPRIGRNPPYMLSLFLYVLMAIPTALTRSFSGFLALRFLTGFLGSPCLATGGATLQDMYSPLKLPYGYTAWVGATFCAPALGPVISAFAISANGYWRWPLWEILWMAVFTFLVMFVAFPETSAPTILFYRARRIRKRFRDQRYISQAEIDEASLSPRQVITVALIRPFQISLLDPAVLFANVYSSYSYGVYYSFFEAFPLVYTDIYGFNLGFMSTAFLSIVVACFLGTLVYLVYISCYLVRLIFPLF